MNWFRKNIESAVEEFAEEIQWSPKWSTGAPIPQVFSNGHITILIYHVETEDADWDGSYTAVIDNESENEFKLALVEFDGATFKFGIANDEVFHGLELWGKGLGFYKAHLIHNSSWVEELKNIHKVHPSYNEQLWKHEKHYCLLFHDDIFEVIAKGYKIEEHKTTFSALSMIAVKRLNQK